MLQKLPKLSVLTVLTYKLNISEFVRHLKFQICENVTQIFGNWIRLQSVAKGGGAHSPTYLHSLSPLWGHALGLH